MIITIDGPAGTGKSTVAKRIADKLGFTFFDTGAMYRAVTFLMLKNNISIDDSDGIKNLLNNFNFKIELIQNNKHYFVNGQDVTLEIRSANVNQYVSNISALSIVREALVSIQRNFAIGIDAVFEGRDMGSVVFPKAELKVYLDAEALIRAERRYQEYLKKNPTSHLNKEDVLKELLYRDSIDSTRAISPLKKADDAHLVDTSNLSIEEVVEKVISLLPTHN